MADLTAARQLADAADKAAEGATEGPWEWETVRTSCGVCHKIGPWPHKWRHGAEMSACIYDDYPSPPQGTDTMLANARLIAASRQLVPAMAATIRALADEVERLREAPKRRYQHLKRDTTYEEIGRGMVQTDRLLSDYAHVVVYRCEATGDLWIRPTEEFDDVTRFRALKEATND